MLFYFVLRSQKVFCLLHFFNYFHETQLSNLTKSFCQFTNIVA